MAGKESRLAELAASQLGIATFAQCVAIGLSGKYVFRRVETGAWQRIHRGVFKVGTSAVNLEERHVAALLVAGRDAVLSHQSAAVQLGLDVLPSPWVQVTIPVDRRVTALNGVVINHASLDARDVQIRGPFIFTKVGRTILDLAACLDAPALRVAIDSSLRKRTSNLKWIRQVCAIEGTRAHGVEQLRKILRQYDEQESATDSALESRFFILCSEFRNQPRLHYRVIEAGRFLAEVDFAWPSTRLCVELDGFRYHGDFTSFERDRARDQALIAHGWTVLRFTWRQISREPDRVRQTLRQALAMAHRDGAEAQL